MKSLQIFLFTIACPTWFIFSSCENSTEKLNRERYPSTLYSDFPYNLADPDTIFYLPAALVEISGLSNYNDSQLLAINDERGVVFMLNATTGSIDDQLTFGGGGDYEGIEYIDPRVFVAESNGDLHMFSHPFTDRQSKTIEIKSELNRTDDVEGLGVNAMSGSLMLACKGGKKKRIYRLPLSDIRTDLEELAAINKDQLKSFAEAANIPLVTKVSFKPSGIAWHPSGDIYVIAHHGKALVVLDSTYQIKTYLQLNPFYFQQPEGICFTRDGTLFVSNEGVHRPASLLKFKRK